MRYNIYAQYDKVRRTIQFTFMAENDQVALRTFTNRLKMDEKAIGIEINRDDYDIACIGEFNTDLIFNKSIDNQYIYINQPIKLNETCYIVGKEGPGIKGRDYSEKNENNKGVE